MNAIVVIDESKCTGCGACAELCPRKILYVDEQARKCRVTDETLCDKRRGCERVCKFDAITIR
jgi:Na+-translocating ferredoxin:NAD+ oxidoreductase subunit B